MATIGVRQDVIQTMRGKEIFIPEIRVWMHPADGSECYYLVFDSFKDAFEHIEKHPEVSEEIPLIAFRGYEINIFTI